MSAASKARVATVAAMLLASAACRDARRATRVAATTSDRAAAPAAAVASADSAGLPEDTLRVGAFGTVHLLRSRAEPAHVLLFLSGDGGWDATAGHIARHLAAVDALVVGVDDRAYLAALRRRRGRCAYPAADLEALSQYVQKRLDRARYDPPVLVGHSSGAALAYAALAQAPPNTFRGAVSLGFCPALAVSVPFCRLGGVVERKALRDEGSGRRRVTTTELRLPPDSALDAPWTALAGARDQACVADSVRAFAARVPGASVVVLPAVGHGFGDPAAWLPAFRDAYARMVPADGPPPGGGEGAAGSDVRDLPLIEVHAPAGGGDTFAVVLSGDGGWASIDRQIAGVFAAHGVPVVGLNSLQYFWRGSTPDSSARDLARVVRHYTTAWGKGRVLLVGYSRGADVLPFMAARLPDDLRSRVRLVALLAPSRTATFRFHLSDWFGGGDGADALPTRPEIARLRGTPVLCVHGTDEEASACQGLDPAVATSLSLPGGHHLGGDYSRIAERILDAAR